MAERRPKGSGAVSQRKDGLWVARIDAGVTPQGTRRRITVSSRSKQECLRKLKEMQRKIAAGNVPAAASARLTVRAWADLWLPMHASRVRPTTYTTDSGTIRKWIVPTLGHRRLADLTPADLRALREAITKAGRSTTTALHSHKILLKMLKDAQVEGHDVPERIMKAPKPAKAANDRSAIPVEQALRILAVATARPDAPRWVSALLQGMRQGESLGLEWSRVDLEAGTVDVSWQLQWMADDVPTPDGWEERRIDGVPRARLTRPKTASGVRVIPLVPWMVAAFKVAAERWEPNPWGLVWTVDGLPIKPDEDRLTWRAIQQEAEVAHPAGRPWHLHESRHTTATLLAEQGVDRAIIEAILGQAVLVESYLHVGQEHVRRALEGVASRLQLEA
jgi:integrase